MKANRARLAQDPQVRRGEPLEEEFYNLETYPPN
jgi:hypothetical protein